MKRFMTAFVLCMLLAGFASTHALAVTWDGSEDSDWLQGLNWIGDDYPGSLFDDDTATIADPTSNQCALSDTLLASLHWVQIDAASGAMSLTLDNNSSSLVIDRNGAGGDVGYLELLAGDAASENALFYMTDGTAIVSDRTEISAAASVAANATLRIDGADQFDPAALQIYGGSGSAGLALFDFDAGTLTNPDSLTMRGLSKVDSEQNIAGVGNLVVDADSGSPIAAQAEIDMLSGKTITASTATIDAQYAACKLDKTGAGTLTVSGALEVYSGLDSGENAEFQLTTGSLTFSSMTLDGFSSSAKVILDLDQDVTQGSSDVAVADYADIQVASGKTFTVDDLVVGDNDNAGADYNGILAVSGGGTISAQRIIIRGETGGGSTLTASSSSIVTR